MRARYRIADRIKLAVVALGVSLLILWGSLIAWLFALQTNFSRESLQHSAQTVMEAVDAEIDKYAAAGRTLARTFAAQGNDLKTLEAQARIVAPAFGDAWVVLVAPEGQQIFNTRTPEGQVLPKRSAAGQTAQAQACRSDEPQVSDVGIGPVLGRPVVSVNFPIMLETKCYALAVVFPVEVFSRLMQGLPAGWLAGVADGTGHYVTRSLSNEALVGAPISDGWRRTMRQEGVYDYKSREGDDLVSANVPSRRTGWGSSVAVRRAALYGPFLQSVAIAGALGAAAIILSLLVVSMLGRRIAVALATTRQAALNLRSESFAASYTGEQDIDAIVDVLHGTSADLQRHERQRADHEKQMELAARETVHRSKNLIAVIASMAHFIGKEADSAPAFSARLNERLQALSRCQDLLLGDNQLHAGLDDIARAQIAPFAGNRLRIGGEKILVLRDNVQPLGLIFHELATNAAKYGALSVPTGKIDVSWESVARDDTARTVRLLWQENGGPRPALTGRTGFGSLLIAESCKNLGGEARLEFLPQGLVCTIVVRLPQIEDAPYSR